MGEPPLQLLRGLRIPLRLKVGTLSVSAVVLLTAAFLGAARTVFVPGPTSDGHHLFEASCGSCHTSFRGSPRARCQSCHPADRAPDTHPAGIFDDPRWVQTLEQIDAQDCVACHGEHRLADGGVTVDRDFCVRCHDQVVGERASHASFAPSSCGQAGCHNYHDNSALNTAFLTRHRDEPDRLPRPGVLERTVAAGKDVEARFPADLAPDQGLVERWRASAHAGAGVSCADCHDRPGSGFVRAADDGSCERCHGFEAVTFRSGKHGVRRAAGLPDLSPADARLPMKPDAPRRLGCGTCHEPHGVDTRRAAVEACLSCHDDGHSRAFLDSPHGATWRASATGSRPPASAVSCATCHLPRVESGDQDRRVAVNHHNTLTLARPDRMAKLVCMDCHGLPFALSSLLDERVVRASFRGRPARMSEAISMVRFLARETGGREEDKQ